jgi:outer membrane protein TolC
MRPRKSVLALCLPLLLAGCATSAIEMAPERPDRPWTPAVTPGGEIVAGSPSRGSTAGGYVLPANPALGVLPPPPSMDTAKLYSLAELIDIAESANPKTRIAWDEARRAALAAGIAESTYLPKITVTAVGGYQHSNGATGSESLRGTVAAASLLWLLFDFGERQAVVESARQASVVSNIAFTASHQQLIYDVSVAFYAYAAAQAGLETASASLKNADAVRAAAEDRYKHGIGTLIEVAQARQAVAQAKLALVQATGGAQDSYLALITAMGISPLTKIKIADVSGRKLSASMVAPVETIISQALARRPDVLSAYAAEKASLANVRAAKAEFMPKVFVSATGSHNSGTLRVTGLPGLGGESPTMNIDSNRTGGIIVAGVTVPLFDGGRRAAQLDQARAAADSAKARLTQAQDDAVREIAVADNALRTSLESVAAAGALVEAAQTTFDAALGAYRSGVGSSTDVTIAETQLLQAKNAATNAYSTALSSAATLALAAGSLGSAPDYGL